MLPRGQIFYDASCGLCTEGYRRFGSMTERRGYKWVPLQEPRVRHLLGLEDGEMPDEMKLLTTGGRMLGGVDAILHIAKSIWWASPAWMFSKLPGVRPVLRVLYRKLAKNRHRVSGACGFDPSQPPVKRAA